MKTLFISKEGPEATLLLLYFKWLRSNLSETQKQGETEKTQRNRLTAIEAPVTCPHNSFIYTCIQTNISSTFQPLCLSPSLLNLFNSISLKLILITLEVN